VGGSRSGLIESFAFDQLKVDEIKGGRETPAPFLVCERLFRSPRAVVRFAFAPALGVVAGPMLADYISMIRSRPCHLVVLLPTVEAIVEPEGLDTTELTPAETVDAILLRTS
jgi:hypothetical protein